MPWGILLPLKYVILQKIHMTSFKRKESLLSLTNKDTIEWLKVLVSWPLIPNKELKLWITWMISCLIATMIRHFLLKQMPMVTKEVSDNHVGFNVNGKKVVMFDIYHPNTHCPCLNVFIENLGNWISYSNIYNRFCSSRLVKWENK